jgi:hypothetical protein
MPNDAVLKFTASGDFTVTDSDLLHVTFPPILPNQDTQCARNLLGDAVLEGKYTRDYIECKSRVTRPAQALLSIIPSPVHSLREICRAKTCALEPSTEASNKITGTCHLNKIYA